MRFLHTVTFKGLLAAALLGLLFCSGPRIANAGVLSYTQGTGGTFDVTTSSTFTGASAFTQWDVSHLSTTYTKVKVQFAWSGPGALPASSFSITGISLAQPTTTTAFSNVIFDPTTASYSTSTFLGDILETSQRNLSSSVNKTSGANVKLSFTIPIVGVSNGWTLLTRLQFKDAPENNINSTGWQTATYDGSSVPEPGTSAIAGGLLAWIIFVQRRRRRQNGHSSVADDHTR